MSIRQRFANMWEGMRNSETLYDPPPIGSPESDSLFEPLTAPGRIEKLRNLRPIDQIDQLRTAHLLYVKNPLAKRIIQIPAEYIIGDGINFTAENPQVQAILNNHWFDTTNNWGVKQMERAQELGLTGEQCIPVFVAPQTGHVTLGHIDPELIDRVVTDPVNGMKQYAVILKRSPLSKDDLFPAYRVIDIASVAQGEPAFGRFVGLAKDEEQAKEWGMEEFLGDTGRLVTPSTGSNPLRIRWVGSCFFFTVNNPMSANRGWSDLFAEADWIDAHDQFLFAEVEKAINAGKWVMDVLLKGMNETQQRAWLAKRERNLKPGTWLTRNESIEYKIQNTDLHLEDATALGTSIKNHVVAGTGLPPFWFAEAMGSRATAPEMTEPTFKHLKSRQRVFAHAVSRILRYSIDMAVLHGYIRQDKRTSVGSSVNVQSTSFYLRMPDLSAKDQRALASAIKSISSALKDATASGFIEGDEAAVLFKRYLEMIGLSAWKTEPVSQNLPPDPRFDTTRVFKMSESTGVREFSHESETYYVNIDQLKISDSKDKTRSNGIFQEATAEEKQVPIA